MTSLLQLEFRGQGGNTPQIVLNNPSKGRRAMAVECELLSLEDGFKLYPQEKHFRGFTIEAGSLRNLYCQVTIGMPDLNRYFVEPDDLKDEDGPPYLLIARNTTSTQKWEIRYDRGTDVWSVSDAESKPEQDRSADGCSGINKPKWQFYSQTELQAGYSQTEVPMAAVDAGVPMVAKACISYDQLSALNEEAKILLGDSYATATMRDVVNIIIKPSCDRTGVSYAFQLNPDGLLVEVFVSHAWDEKFCTFADELLSEFRRKAKKPTFWICAFALVQSDDAALIAAQVGDPVAPLAQAPFMVAMAHATWFLIVRNEETDLWTRCWCVAELFYAKEDFKLVPDKAIICGPDAFKDVDSSCLDAKCFSVDDRVKILHALVGNNEAEKVKALDRMIAEFRRF